MAQQLMLDLPELITRFQSQVSILGSGIGLLRTLAQRREQLFEEKIHTAGYIDAELTANLVDIEAVVDAVSGFVSALRATNVMPVFVYTITPRTQYGEEQKNGVSYFELTKDNGSSQGQIVARNNQDAEVDLDWETLVEDASDAAEDIILMSNAKDPANNGYYRFIHTTGAVNGKLIFDAPLSGSSTAKDTTVKISLVSREL